jgi:hypothetical protein
MSKRNTMDARQGGLPEEAVNNQLQTFLNALLQQEQQQQGIPEGSYAVPSQSSLAAFGNATSTNAQGRDV